MTRTIPLFCAAAVLLLSATPLYAQQQPSLLSPYTGDEITLTDASDEADADKISSLIDTMTNNVRACIKTHQASVQECQCKFPSDLTNIKQAYDSALRIHPDWDGKMVSYKKGTEPTTSVSFSGLKGQFDSCEKTGKSL